MPIKPLPEIDSSDLKAVRRFLTSVRDEEAGTRAPRGSTPPLARTPVPLRNGIARARTRPPRGPEA